MTTAPIIATLKETAAVRANSHADTPPKPPHPVSAEGSAKADAVRADLAALPDEVLAILATAVPKEIADRHAKAEAEIIAFVQEQLRAQRVSPESIRAALAGKTPAKPRAKSGGIDGRSVVRDVYWNPKDHSQRTHGRGPRKPQWFLDHLAAGGTEADMRIPEGEK